VSELWAHFLGNTDRVIHKWTHYFPVYESHLRRFVNRPVLLVEIGVGSGGSLQMWKRYLGPFAQIIGIDIEERCRDFEEDQIAIRIGDQGDEAFLLSVLDEFGMPNVVLDDGSHRMADVSATFDFLYPRLAPSGLYMVEDLHTAYWAEFGGDPASPVNFITRSKSLIDELNADHSRGLVPPTTFTHTTLSMHFYDSMIVFERGRHLRKHAPRTGSLAADWE
jgi:hypothetical protein